MFGAFRYSKTTRNYEHVQLLNDDKFDARGYALVACDSCRAQKLKCSGNRNGCDRCLASPLVTCTYVGRKRPRHLPIPSTPEGPSSESKRAKSQHSIEQRRVEDSTSRKASRVSITRSATDAASSAPSPLTSMTIIEPLPTPTDSNLSWELFDEFTNLDEFRQSPSTPFPNPDLDWGLLDSMQSPVTPSTRTDHDLRFSSVAVARESQGISDRDQDLGLEFANQQPKQGHHMASRPAPAPTLHSSQPAGKSGRCRCLSSMTELLEDMDVGVDTTGIDTLLMCLGRGTKTCSDVLACIHCNACTEHAMLLATVAQQLVSIAKKAPTRLLLVHHEDQDPDADSGRSCEIRDYGISFGKYRIELPELKVRFTHQMVLLHLEDLQKLLADIKDRTGPKTGARELLTHAESKTAKVCWMIRGLSK